LPSDWEAKLEALRAALDEPGRQAYRDLADKHPEPEDLYRTLLKRRWDPGDPQATARKMSKAGSRPNAPRPRGAPEETVPAKKASNARPEDPEAFVREELRRREIADPMFEAMDGQTTGKVENALRRPDAKAGRSRQRAAEVWALEGAGNNPREFANRYEYARAKFTAAQASAAKQLKNTPGARSAAAEAAATRSRPSDSPPTSLATIRPSATSAQASI
jgi:hypothetical protein